MESRRRADRFGIIMCEEVLSLFSLESGAWYETQEEIEAGLAWGAKKKRLLRWLYRQMKEGLSARERECLMLHFLEGLTYRQIAERTNTNPSSALRGVQRSLRKLRLAARTRAPRPRKVE